MNRRQSWRSFTLIGAAMAACVAIGLTFGKQPLTLGRLRTELRGQPRSAVLERFGPPVRELQRPYHTGPSLIYGPLVPAQKGYQPPNVIFDLDAQQRVVNVYSDSSLVRRD